MEGRIHRLLLKIVTSALLASVLSVAAPVMAEEKTEAQRKPLIEPEIERRELIEAKIDDEDFELGLFAGFLSIEDFGSSSLVGLRAAYHVNEVLFLEAMYGRAKGGKTSYENLSGGAPLLTDAQREYSYYNLSLGFDLLPGEAFLTSEHAFNTALYLIAGAGSTTFAGDDHFTINYGVGYRFLVTDYLAIHTNFRDHLFNMDLLGESKTTHNIELSFSATVFF